MSLQYSQNGRTGQARYLQTEQYNNDLKVMCRDDSGQQLTGFIQTTGETSKNCNKCSLYWF